MNEQAERPSEVLRGGGLYDDPHMSADGKYIPSEFETWEHEGKTYHAIGLVNFWWRGYTDLDTWTDPPQPSPEFLGWLKLYGVDTTDFLLGPPHLVFPDAESAELFRQEWHVPGEVQRGSYYEWCHRARPKSNVLVTSSHDDMNAAMERAKQVRRSWIKANRP